MAKTTKCAFCGAEITTGLFTGNAEKNFVEQLQQFKQIIGSQLPIVKVSNFK